MAGEGNAQYHVIDLVPEDKEESFYKIRLKIDKTTNLLDKWTIFDKAGNIFNYEVTNFQIERDLTEDDFVFDPSEYPDIEVLDFR
jgi:outer membrane lipoprotein-sorting protein